MLGRARPGDRARRPPRRAPTASTRWKATRDEIADAILTRGWNDDVGAFTQSFGSDELDASNLMMPIVGFLPADDPRMLATIDAIADRSPTSAAWSTATSPHDGLDGEEGTFLLCTFWLAQALALAGRRRPSACDLRAGGRATRTTSGLLAEEVDPRTGELLGNFPQAFSHIGLVNAAWAIAQAEGND